MIVKYIQICSEYWFINTMESYTSVVMHQHDKRVFVNFVIICNISIQTCHTHTLTMKSSSVSIGDLHHPPNLSPPPKKKKNTSWILEIWTPHPSSPLHFEFSQGSPAARTNTSMVKCLTKTATYLRWLLRRVAKWDPQVCVQKANAYQYIYIGVCTQSTSNKIMKVTCIFTKKTWIYIYIYI